MQDDVQFNDFDLEVAEQLPDLDQALSMDPWVVHSLDKESFSEEPEGTYRVV